MTGLVVKSIPRQGVVVLSSGSASPYEIPADVGQTFPDDATCHVVFTDTNGDTVADIDGTVFSTKCQWLFYGADIDAIKRGMNFESFLVTSDATPYKLRYGKVLRREATFEYASQLAVPPPVVVNDNFANRTGQPGKMYAQVLGNTRIHDNSGFVGIGATGNGLGVDIGGLFQTSGVRINRPMSTDDMEISATIVTPYGLGTTGLTVIGLAGNSGLTNGIGVQLNSLTNHAQVVQVTGPGRSQVNGLGSAVSDNPDDFDTYTLTYNDQSKMFNVYKNSSSTALLSYHDTSALITHGQGYRYPFFLFDASLVSTGPQITSWQAQDTVG